MPATTLSAAILLIEHSIVLERRHRAEKLEAGLRRLAEELQESIDHEISLAARRLEAMRSIDGDAGVLELENRGEGDAGMARKSAPVALMEILASAGSDGLHGPELNERARRAGLKTPAIEQAKQRLKDRRWIMMEEGTRIWRLGENAPAANTVNKTSDAPSS